MTSVIVPRIVRHIQVLTVILRYRHKGAASGRSRRRIVTGTKLDRTIVKVRFGLLTLRWHILIVHRHVGMWIFITWILSIIIIGRRRRHFRSRRRLICKV